MDRDQTRRSAAEQLTTSLLALLDAAAEQVAQRVVEELQRREGIRDRRERGSRHKSGSPLDEHPEEKVASVRLLTCKRVVQLIGMSRATLWRMEREGRFPVRRRIGTRGVGWIEEEVRRMDRPTRGGSDLPNRCPTPRRSGVERYGRSRAETSTAVAHPRTPPSRTRPSEVLKTGRANYPRGFESHPLRFFSAR